MKRLNATLLGLLMIVAPLLASAQPGHDRIRSLKIAFITEKVDLTPDEATKFWPVYNAHQDKMQALRKDMRMERMEARNNWDDMSDKEVESMIDGLLDTREKEVQLEKEFHTQVKKILPIRKVAKLYRAEHEFRTMIIEKLRDRRQGGGPGGRAGGGFR